MRANLISCGGIAPAQMWTYPQLKRMEVTAAAKPA